MGKGSKQTTTQSNTVDPKLLNLYYSNYANANDVANTPFQPFTGQRVAGLNDTQKQAMGLLTGVANNNTGVSTLDSAKAATSGLLGFTPQNVSAPTVKAGLLKDADLSSYMNPFTQNVLDASLADLTHARDVQRVQDNQTATAAKAFGGSRQGVADALTNNDFLRNVASTSANLRSAGYDRAVSAASSDLDRTYGADTFNAGNAFDASKTNAANDMSGAGFRLGAAAQLGNLSNDELTQALQRAGALATAGDTLQRQDQAQKDFDFEEFMRQIGYPIQQQQLRNQALGMIPMQQTQTSTTSQSGGGGLLSGILGIASTAAQLGAFSDMRTKENVRTSHYDAKGRRWVDFNYKWDDPSVVQRGVIAQEILATDPDAVSVDGPTGFLRVDYSKLGVH